MYGFVKEFSECIGGIYPFAKEIAAFDSSGFKRITDAVVNNSTFTGYSFVIVLMKLFGRPCYSQNQLILNVVWRNTLDVIAGARK